MEVYGYSEKMTPRRSFEVPEVLEVHEVPSEEVRIVPELPTETNNPLELVVSSVVVAVPEFSVDSSFSSLQEKMVRLKQEIRKTNTNFFIFSSIPKLKYYCFV